MLIRLTLLWGCVLLYSSGMYGQILGTPVFYEDFSDGIPSGWDSLDASGIAHWEYRGPFTWPDISVASRGSCGASGSLIQSESYSNGFVIFDSNYWDDDGAVCGNLGSGQVPAPHDAALVTPSINLSGVNTVVLTWQQHFKRFQSTLTVDVSTNSGQTWSNVFTASPVFTSNTIWQTVNITSLAANQPDVRIRFRFTGTYYWWQLDDIALYAPNPNDIRILNPKYTTYNPADTILFNNMEYDSYPSVMIPPFKFSAQDQNIGGNAQTGCRLITRVRRANDLTQVFNVQSGSVTIAPGQTVTHNIATTYTAASATQSYIITYNVDQTQVDDNESNNWDTLDFRITPFTYARDERRMDDALIPALTYQDETQQIGNTYQARLAAPKKCHAIGVGFSNQTLPGTVVHGVIYQLNTWEVLAETEDYTVNIADLNAPGDEKIVSLPLITPLNLMQDSVYVVMVSHNAAEGGAMRIARSGEALPNVSLLRYPDSNALFYLLKHPMVRMHIFSASSNPGCTNPLADNYLPEANIDDGGCRFYGCTAQAACNYDPVANYDDGSCCFGDCATLSVSGSTDESIGWQLTNGEGTVLASGQGNGEVDVCLLPSCYNLSLSDAQGDGWNGASLSLLSGNGAVYFSGTLSDGNTLTAQIAVGGGVGCTDPGACNYQPTALCDDGTCVAPTCADPDALNYDPDFVCGGGQCLYCRGDLNDDLTVNTTDFLIFSSVFGCSSQCGGADLDFNGTVNIVDFLVFTSYFGQVCGGDD